MDYLPFTYKDWSNCDNNGDMNFENVEMTEDFGPIKKGEKFEIVSLCIFDERITFFHDRECDKYVTVNFKVSITPTDAEWFGY